MSTMYCPKCNSNVLATREDLDICLMIILLIFTGGIGLIIYLVIYYGKDPIRCVHCNSICKPKLVEREVRSSYQNINPTYEAGTVLTIEKEQENIEIRSKYCFNCGTQLDQRAGLKFCPFCGSKIE
jgi:DNA-directed RNA polymerase subunit RPC12/RpoP